MVVSDKVVNECMPAIDVFRRARDFREARVKAWLATWKARLTGRSSELLPLEEVKRLVHTGGERYVEIRSVSVDRIVGSEGRFRDFTRSFLPRSRSLQRRWERVDAAYYDETILPPVKLVELGGVYFVRDGNHRVSVARSKQERPFVDAEIVHLDAKLVLDPDVSLADIRELAASAARTSAADAASASA